MLPFLTYIGSASIDINILYPNMGPCIIDPAGAVPTMIDYTVVTPVKVHDQPAPDYQTEAKCNERWSARVPSLDIDN
jgi:hypothetical protein